MTSLAGLGKHVNLQADGTRPFHTHRFDELKQLRVHLCGVNLVKPRSVESRQMGSSGLADPSTDGKLLAVTRLPAVDVSAELRLFVELSLLPCTCLLKIVKE